MTARPFQRITHACVIGCFVFAGVLGIAAPPARGADPDPKLYWDVRDLRPGMKGVGKTVMVGTELVEFEAEVLGVLCDVNPGRDMILCRLSGCNLEHAGIIQGMSGSPIYIDGKLVGAVAYAWEFAKDPIAGVTPFSQMVEYVKHNERRIAAEAERAGRTRTASLDLNLLNPDLDALALPDARSLWTSAPVNGGAIAGMRPIATPLAASGFSPRALGVLERELGPLGMAPVAGGRALDEIMEREGNKPLAPGSPVSVAFVTGDLDLSGIGTVTHIEGDRVYAFGHPMMGLGSCELPMMTGYIHTVYPRANVSMKMGSPLKVAGVLDTDVSTAISGRIGAVPDMLPMTVRVDAGRLIESREYHVQVAREPNMLASLVMSVLTSAVDAEGNLPEELTARVSAVIKIKDYEPIHVRDSLSGPRLSGPSGPMALFLPVANTVNSLSRNPIAPVRIEEIVCDVLLEPRRSMAEVVSMQLERSTLAPGETLRAHVTVKPQRGARTVVTIDLPLPGDFPEGTHEVSLCDQTRTLQRKFRNEPALLEPRGLSDLINLIRARAEPSRTALSLHVALPGRGVAVEGQALPDLPASARALLASPRRSAEPPVRTDLIATLETPWVVDGGQNLNFTVVKPNEGLAAGR